MKVESKKFTLLIDETPVAAIEVPVLKISDTEQIDLSKKNDEVTPSDFEKWYEKPPSK